MHAHEKPTFPYEIRLQHELEQIQEWRTEDDRKIPSATDDNLIIATWNLTNFGLQKREDIHLEMMAEILKPFDVIAVQEIADDLEHLRSLLSKLGGNWFAIYTDIAGNDERLAYIYNRNRVVPTGLAAELAMRSYQHQEIVIGEIVEQFEGFNRNPYMVSFDAGQFNFTLVNVHLYWTSFGLRQLETKALSKWAKSRVNKLFPPNNDIILIGDFNMPRVQPGDEIFDLLVENGLQLPKHTTDLIGTNLAGDNHYDEIAFFPNRTEEDFADKMGVFDFDQVVFDDLWDANDKEQQKKFFQYVRYYIADHRPLWAEFHR